MIDLNECMQKGLIRKFHPSQQKAEACITKSKTLLLEAQAELKDRRYNSATIMGYVVLLNLCRAILFRDGYRERSHACTTRYLEEKYKGIIKQEDIELLDHYRETRHEVQYEAEYLAGEEDAKQIVQFAETFLKQIEKIIHTKAPSGK